MNNVTTNVLNFKHNCHSVKTQLIYIGLKGLLIDLLKGFNRNWEVVMYNRIISKNTECYDTAAATVAVLVDNDDDDDDDDDDDNDCDDDDDCHTDFLLVCIRSTQLLSSNTLSLRSCCLGLSR